MLHGLISCKVLLQFQWCVEASYDSKLLYWGPAVGVWSKMLQGGKDINNVVWGVCGENINFKRTTLILLEKLRRG